MLDNSRETETHINSMFISLDYGMQHLRGLNTLLVHQSIPNIQQLRETVFDNLIKIAALLIRLESVHFANRQQTLQTGEHRIRLVRVEQLQRDVHETRPFFGEVVRQNLGDDGDELRAHVGGRRGKDGDQAVAERRALVVGDSLVLSSIAILRRGPAAVDAVFEVDDGCKRAVISKYFLCEKKPLCILPVEREQSRSSERGEATSQRPWRGFDCIPDS
jgi:hypothetical protein